LSFLGRFSKNTQISNFKKIRPVAGEFFHADGQTGDRRTDIHNEANSHFSQFWDAPKKNEYKKGESARVYAIKAMVESKNFTGLDLRLPGGKVDIRRHLPPLIPGTHFC
jgi:hypothetical protein